MFLNKLYPFVAVVGQERLKKAIEIALVNPNAGALLIAGKKGTAKSVLVRSVAEIIGARKIINLPLNVTEDMLFGSIDIEYALSRGQKKFSPGILSRADGNIIYIDEINLLRPELLTAVLNIGSTGVNKVERDGISFSHAAQYTVIGTMNPEEGALPGHILDRFGMCVEAEDETDITNRAEIIKRAISYERDAQAFRASYEAATKKLAGKIFFAQNELRKIELADSMLQLAARFSEEAHCAGHRAEIYLLEAAKAIAALEERDYVLPKDIEEAAGYVLPHRMRKNVADAPEESEFENNERGDDSGDNEKRDDENNGGQEDENQDGTRQNTLRQDDYDNGGASNLNDENEEQSPPDFDPNSLAPEEQTADIDKNFRIPRISLDLGKDGNIRRAAGKRSVTKTDLKQGRYVRAEIPKGKIEDLAFDATIRAAAPFQKMRRGGECALNIKSEDIRQKVREKRVGATFFFAVDASGSMGARERMSAVKGAVFCMLREAYQKRDRIGLLAFRRKEAEIILPVTRSVDLAQKCLETLPTGGKTPLADGLAKALYALTAMNKKEREMEPVLVVITDGRANVFEQNSEDPVKSAIKIADKIRKAKITSVVIDTESDFIKLGIAKSIADAMGASYYNLKKLTKEKILNIVRGTEAG